MVKWRQNVQRKCDFVSLVVHKSIEVICISTSSLLELCCAKTITWIPWGPDARAQGISWCDTNCPLWLVASGCTTGDWCLSISCRTCSCGLCYECRLRIVQSKYSNIKASNRCLLCSYLVATVLIANISWRGFNLAAHTAYHLFTDV